MLKLIRGAKKGNYSFIIIFISSICLADDHICTCMPIDPSTKIMKSVINDPNNCRKLCCDGENKYVYSRSKYDNEPTYSCNKYYLDNRQIMHSVEAWVFEENIINSVNTSHTNSGTDSNCASSHDTDDMSDVIYMGEGKYEK